MLHVDTAKRDRTQADVRNENVIVKRNSRVNPENLKLWLAFLRFRQHGRFRRPSQRPHGQHT
jgi:hypothetical protein